MGKIDDYDITGVPQEQVDFNDDVKNIINFGKYQPAVVSTAPNWPGRRGEFVWFMNGTDGRLYVSGSNGLTNWTQVLTFTVTTG